MFFKEHPLRSPFFVGTHHLKISILPLLYLDFKRHKTLDNARILLKILFIMLYIFARDKLVVLVGLGMKESEYVLPHPPGV